MRWFKKYWVILLLLLIVYSWYGIVHISFRSSSDVLGAQANLFLITQPIDGKTTILAALDSAQREILVAMYLLSDKDIVEALRVAKQRGVDVRVMLEEHPFGSGNVNKTTQKTLQDAHISFQWTNPAFALTHEKTIVIDNKAVFILNQNLTASAFTKNREYDIMDSNPQDVTQVRNLFIADWQKTSYATSPTHIVVSPINARPAIMTLLQSATREIDIEIEDIADEQIVSLLSQKSNIVRIQVIIPTFSQVTSNRRDAEELVQSGVIVKTLETPYVHAKAILVDNTKAYVGSVNLSTQSMDENREVGILLTQPDVMNHLQNTFQSDWEKGRAIEK